MCPPIEIFEPATKLDMDTVPSEQTQASSFYFATTGSRYGLDGPGIESG